MEILWGQSPVNPKNEAQSQYLPLCLVLYGGKAGMCLSKKTGGV